MKKILFIFFLCPYFLFAQNAETILKNQVWELKGYEENGVFSPQSLMLNRSQFVESKGTKAQSVADFFVENQKGHLYSTVDNLDGSYSIDWYDSLQIVENEGLIKFIFINENLQKSEAQVISLSNEVLKYKLDNRVWVWQKHCPKLLDEKWNVLFLKKAEKLFRDSSLKVSIGFWIDAQKMEKPQILKINQAQKADEVLKIVQKINFQKEADFEAWLSEKRSRYTDFLMVLSNDN